MDKKPAEANQAPDSIRKFNLLIAVFCGLLILAHFVSSFFPKSRFWGINQLAYFPIWVRLLFTLPGLLILIPWANLRVYKILEQILSFFQRILPKKEVLTASILAVVSMFFFWLLRTRTYFLGDGYMMIKQLTNERYVKMGIETGEIFAHLYLYKFLKFFFLPSAESIYVGLSILAGGVFVFILFFITKILTESKFERVFIFSIILFAGASELFLGYVEHYSLVFVSVFGYLYFSLRYLQGKVKFIVPVFFCGLAIVFHFSAAYLLPSLFFLLSLKRKKGNWVLNSRRAFAFGSILVLVGILSAYYLWNMNKFLLDIFVPLLHARADSPGYTIFSPSHLLDMLNQNLLLAPVGIALVLSLVLAYKKKIKLGDHFLMFLVIVTISQLLYNLLADPKFGAVRDWDLFSSVALGFILLGVYLFMNLVGSRRYSALALAFTAFLSILPWFLLNTSEGKAIDRLRNLLDLDPKRSYSGRQAIIAYYNRQNRFTEAEQSTKEIFKAFPEDSLNKEAMASFKLGNLEKAEVLVNKAIELNPRFWYAYYNLASIYIDQGRIDQAVDLLRSLLQIDPYQPTVHKTLGYALIEKRLFEEATEELEKAISLGGADAEILNNLAYAYQQSGKTDQAVKKYHKCLEIDPTFYMAHFGLGQVYLQNRYVNQALNEFQQVERLKPDYYPVYYFLGIAHAYKGMREKAIEELELFLKSSQNETENQKVRDFIQQLRSQKP